MSNNLEEGISNDEDYSNSIRVDIQTTSDSASQAEDENDIYEGSRNNVEEHTSTNNEYEKISENSDDEIELSPSTSFLPTLHQQRKQFQDAQDLQIDYNDPVFMVPTDWLRLFLEDTSLNSLSPVEASQKLGKIDTNSLLATPGNPNTLIHDYNYDYSAQRYMPVTKKRWNLLVSWYGLQVGSVPIPRMVIEDKVNGGGQIEFHLPTFYLKKLFMGPLSKANANSPAYRLLFDNQSMQFSATKTIGELYNQIELFLVENITTSGTDNNQMKLRIWYLEDKALDSSPLVLNLTLFKKVALKKLITKDLFGQKLFDMNMNGGYLLLELNDYKGQFPADTLFQKLETLEKESYPGVLQQNSGPNSGESDETDDSDISESKNLFKTSQSLRTPADGTKGFNNLGNSCYMNSALQCLVHIPELANYFFHNIFNKELNVTNPLGKDGKFALAFGNLIHQLYDPKSKGKSYSFAPREFKSIIGHYNSMFYGYQQQDSQEFLAFLLDGLHEDLNRIVNKPYTEKPELSPDKINDSEEVRKLAESCWKNHKLRNDSVILDLFVGLYKSTLKCPECNNISLTFDPFNDLTLPIPIATKWSHKVYVWREGDGVKPQLLEVELNKTDTLENLKHYVAEKLGALVSDLYVFEIFQNQFYKNFQDPESASDAKFLPIGDVISSGDIIIFYEIKDVEKSDILVPVINTVKEGGSYKFSKPFGIPFFIKLSPEDVRSFGTVREKLESKYNSLTTYNYFGMIRNNTNNKEKSKKRKFFRVEDFPQIEKLFARNGINQDAKDLKKLRKCQSDDGSEFSYENVKFPSNADQAQVDETKDDPIEIPENEVENFELIENLENISNSQLTGHLNDSDYDSDISIANPELSSSYAFEIKLYNGQSNRGRHTYGSTYTSQHDIQNDSKTIWVPYTSGQFSNLPNLVDKLPLRKKLFYSYSADDYNGLSSDESNKEHSVEEVIGSQAEDEIEELSSQYFSTNNSNTNKESITSLKVQGDAAVDVPQLYASLPDGQINNPIELSDSGSSNFGAIHLDNADLNDNESLSQDENLNTLFVDKGPINITSDSDEDPLYGDKANNPQLLNTDKHPVLVSYKDALICEWDPALYNVFFSGNEEEDEGGQGTWENPEVLNNPELEDSRKAMEEMKNKSLTLKDCLETFSKPEILGQNDLWYCPTCKEHRQAEKQIEIWNTPDILTMHLKRFENQRRFSDKIDAVIDFPIEGLDMKPFVSNKAGDGKSYIYDLVAVDNHYGGLGGGHYTSYAKNFVDGKWYYYDDSSVTPADPNRAIAGSAYLLFYRRRSSEPLGGTQLTALLKEARKNEELDLQKRYFEEIKKLQDIVLQIRNYNALYGKLDQLEDSSAEDDEHAEKNKLNSEGAIDVGFSDDDLSSYSSSMNPPS